MKKTNITAVTVFVLLLFFFGLSDAAGRTNGMKKMVKTIADFAKKADNAENTNRFLEGHTGEILSWGKNCSPALPTFLTLFADYNEEGTGLIYNYKKQWQEIFDPWGIVSPRKKKRKKENPEPSLDRPYDLRTLPYIYQNLAMEGVMNFSGQNESFGSISMQLLDIFPLDNDRETAGFLKNYIWFTQNNSWVDAACILSTFLSRSELERFAAALHAQGQKEKGDHLLELTLQPCGQFQETAEQNLKRLFYFPLDSPDLDFMSNINGRVKLIYAVECSEESYNGFLAEELALLAKQGVKGQTRYLKKIVNQGPLLKKLLAMDILSNHKSLPDMFFKKFLHVRGNDISTAWTRIEALQVLRRRGAALSKKELETLLQIPDPFTVFYALYWVEKNDKEWFGHILKQLARRGKSVCQKNALEKLYQCFGYNDFKSAVSFVKEKNLTLPAMKYYLQKAYENKDKAVLARRFRIEEKPAIMIPAVYALFDLDRQGTLVKIRQFLTQEYYRFRDKKGIRMDERVMEHLLTMVVESPVRTDIPPLALFVNKGFFVSESKNALEYMVPAITQKDIRWMEGQISRERLCQAAARFYKPEFLPYLNYCLKGGETGLAEPMLKSGHEDLSPLWRHHIKREEQKAPPEKKDELLITVFIRDNFNSRRSFVEDVADMKEGTAALDELTWCIENRDDFTALYALRKLLDFPTLRSYVNDIDATGRINRIMEAQLQAGDDFMKVPGVIWFARRGDVSVLPLLGSLLYKHPVPRYILADELIHYPPDIILPLVVNIVRARHYDVWEKIDLVLKTIAQKSPRSLAPYIDFPDIEVKKKMLGALKYAERFDNWKKVYRYLDNKNTTLAFYAFEALSGRGKWRKKDLNALISLYRRLKSPVIKVDILGAVGRIDTPAARAFLNTVVRSDPLTRDYAALYASFFNNEKCLSILETTEDINIFKEGLTHLRTPHCGGPGPYLELLLKNIFDDNQAPEKYSNRLNTLLLPAEKNQSIKKKPLITIKLPETPETVTRTITFEIPGIVKENTHINRTFQFKNRFAHLWEGELTTDKESQVHVSFSTGLEKWSVPASFKEIMRMENPSMTELSDGRYLVYYLKCTDPDSLSQPRPFFRLLNKEGRFEEGYFPLKNLLTFSEITVFQRGEKYYMAAIGERGVLRR